MRRILVLLFISVLSLISVQSIYSQISDSLKIARALELVKLAQLEYMKIKDYQAIIISSEIIDGNLRKTENIQAMYLHPGNVYLKWLHGPYEGMQASYVPSRDKSDCFMARETGIKSMLGTKTWTNTDAIVKILYPHHFTIQQTSLAYFFETMQTIIIKAQKLGKLSVISISETTDKYTQMPAISVLVQLSQNPKDGLKWSKVHLFFDKDQKLPFHFILYDFKGQKSGEYAFTSFKKNTGLALLDFEIQ